MKTENVTIKIDADISDFDKKIKLLRREIQSLKINNSIKWWMFWMWFRPIRINFFNIETNEIKND